MSYIVCCIARACNRAIVAPPTKISIPRAAFGTAQQPHSQKEAAIASRPLSGPKGSLSSLLLLVPVPKYGDATGQAIFCRIGTQHGVVRRQRHENMIVRRISRDGMRGPGGVRVGTSQYTAWPRQCGHVVGREQLHQRLVL